MDYAGEFQELRLETEFLLDLAARRLAGRFIFLRFAFWKRPVVVLRPVNHHQFGFTAESTPDKAAGRHLYFGHIIPSHTRAQPISRTKPGERKLRKNHCHRRERPAKEYRETSLFSYRRVYRRRVARKSRWCMSPRTLAPRPVVAANCR